MTPFALIIKHRTQPGKRDDVRKVWEKHMAPAISANPGHTAYFYCFDNNEPDSIYAFQQYLTERGSVAGVSANQRLRGVFEGNGAIACRTSAGHGLHAHLVQTGLMLWRSRK